uniref:Metaxin-1-like n=1 Tax=Crassostrea virginica TaxID=6565 RepID=A0A8B8E2N1_CRAVI|nr:metaxin-1-like [Crassostrea virginica]
MSSTEMAYEIKRLDVWSGDWGLPSIDHSCLAIQAYCKFSGIPIKVTEGNNPLKSPSGSLPVFRDGNTVKCHLINIFEYFKEQNIGNDVSMSRKMQADNKAFIYFIEEKLRPAYLHSWWIDANAYTETTRPLFAKATGFPLSLYVTKKMQTYAWNAVYQPLQRLDATEQEIDKLIYKEAKECLNHLSYKLGDQDFFFGDCPTSLDAMVFGYIAPLIKGPLVSNQLIKHINSCPNLCNHTNRILSRFFPPTEEDLEKMKQKEKEKKEALKNDVDFPNKTRNMILAGVFAVSAMMAFAYSSGAIRIQDTSEMSIYDMDEDPEENES